MIHYRKRTWVMLLGMFVAAFAFTFLTAQFKDNNEAKAANPWAFDPGYIISDWQMNDYSSMSEGDIQAFLSRINPCNNRDYGLYQQQSSMYPNVHWHWSGDHFVCLSEERFGDGMTIGSGDTAAHIIWQTAQEYRINPKVLIVLIEKESSLITDSFPHSGQYRTMTGFGCPDTAPCDAQYFGFKNQLRMAAGLFREVMDGGWTNYPVGPNFVLYNPNRACGGTTVNIRNRATSALYRYTPYQPNQSALAAGYGLGDSCGAYGNRNFYLLFEDWFGGIKDEGYAIPASSDVMEGIYIVQSAMNDDKVIDAAGGASEDGTNVQIWNDNRSGAQKWEIKRNGNGSYTLVNQGSGKALDVFDAGRYNGVNVQLFTSNGTCAQEWQIVRNEDETYTLYSNCSGAALDVSNADTTDGANIQIYRPNGTAAQKWKLEAVPSGKASDKLDEGTYILESALDGKKAMDISGGAEGAKNKSNVDLWDKNETNAQRWKIMKNSDGTYTFVNPYSGLALDVNEGSERSKANVQVYEKNTSCAQKWVARKNSDGAWMFISACSDKALDVDNAKAANGTNLHIYTANGTAAQRWNLRKTTELAPKPEMNAGNSMEKPEYEGQMDTLVEAVYEIRSKVGNNQVIDIYNGAEGAVDETNIQIYESNKTEAQKWQLKKNSDGTWTFVNPHTKKVLDVKWGETANYTNVWLYNQNGTCSQKWKARKNSDGSWTFLSACATNRALDVSGAGNTSGTNVQIFEDNGTVAQRWEMRKL